MAGLYIHIPFCASRCVYCGFYSTTLKNRYQEYVDAVQKELCLRKDYLRGEAIQTIYIGGGTPSQLPILELTRLINAITNHLSPITQTEFTIECNPDDITPEYAKSLALLGINRVSMGAQSFSDERLRFLNRRHKAQQVRDAVVVLRNNGIENISIDLMFGFPDETLDDWRYDIDEALKLHVNHISAYSLMYEEGTLLYRMLEEGKIEEIDEETSRQMYEMLIDMLTSNGYEHYEISNFALPGYRSRHNSSYWQGIPYLGLGVAAHSYNRNSRQWNIDDVYIYIKKVNEGVIPSETEVLTDDEKYNDLITTALRTREGLRIEQAGRYKDYLLSNAQPQIKRGLLALEDNRLHLTRKGLFVSDDVMSELIYV